MMNLTAFYLFRKLKGVYMITINRWSTANDLKFNGDKTEVLHITSRFRNSYPSPCVQICNLLLEPVESARNL